MKNRFPNFGAGPSRLPDEVVERLREEFSDRCGRGFSLVEFPHRSRLFEDIKAKAVSLLAELLRLPSDYEILFIHGGANIQFLMIPYNWMRNGKKGSFVDTGVWSLKAIAQARKWGEVDILASGGDSGYRKIPEYRHRLSGLDEKKHAFLHLTSNNTIYGTRWAEFPESPVPLVCDASSDILSREFPVEKFGAIYGGTQKNMGVSGLGFCILRRDMLVEAEEKDPDMLMYSTYAKHDSTYNTPNVFAIYVTSLCLEWLKKQGGVEAIRKENERKAEKLYRTIDESDFYRNGNHPPDRSPMNVVFNLEDVSLENVFLEEATREKLLFLKGHRLAGGLRASIYNACPFEDVERLSEFMKDFARRKG